MLSSKGGLGRRLLRDLRLPGAFLNTPQADISIDELRVLFNSDNPLVEFIRHSVNSLSVEVGPAVHVLLRWPATKRNGNAIPVPSESDIGTTITVLQQLGGNLETALKICQGVVAHLRRGQIPDSSSSVPRKQKRRKTLFGREGEL